MGTRESGERRKSPRLEKKLTVQYKIQEMPQTTETRASMAVSTDITRTKDLSEKGIYITTSGVIFPKTILDIKLRLPTEEKSIELKGRVVVSEEIKKDYIYGARIEFVDLEDKQQEALREFIQLVKEKGK